VQMEHEEQNKQLREILAKVSATTTYGN